MDGSKQRERSFEHPAILDLVGTGGLPESDANLMGTTLVAMARPETRRRPVEVKAPSPEEVRRRREARQMQELNSDV